MDEAELEDVSTGEGAYAACSGVVLPGSSRCTGKVETNGW